jgi:hypothetical protein
MGTFYDPEIIGGSSTKFGAELKGRIAVRKWTVNELLPVVARREGPGDRGRAVFAAAVYYCCHRFEGEGGMVGPDLTAMARRFNERDLLEAVIEPDRLGPVPDLPGSRPRADEPGQDISGNTLWPISRLIPFRLDPPKRRRLASGTANGSADRRLPGRSDRVHPTLRIDGMPNQQARHGSVFYLAVVLALLPSGEGRGAETSVGAATVSITPSQPVALSGQMNTRISKGVRSPVTATALAVESKQEGKVGDQAILVSCDLVGIDRAVLERVRALLQDQLPDFDGRKLVLSATQYAYRPRL